MTSTLIRIAALCSLTALAACNTTTTASHNEARSGSQITGTFPPSPDASNPSVNPDGTVKRLAVSR